MKLIVWWILAFLLFPTGILHGQTENQQITGTIYIDLVHGLTRPGIIPPSLLRLRTTTVPEFTGRTFDNEIFSSELQKSGLKPGRFIEIMDSTMAGQIIMQVPAPGFHVFPATQINLIVTVPAGLSTLKKVITPDVTRFNLFQAKQILQALAFKPGDIVEIPGNQNQQLVFGQFPGKGVPVDPGTLVTLYVSSGVALDQIYIPDLVGKNLERAAELLKMNNLEVGKLSEVFTVEQEGIVLSQSPVAYTPAAPCSKVDIAFTVNRRVPDLTGLSMDEALNLLKKVDLPVGQVKEQKSGKPAGLVIRQSLRPGSEIPDNAVIDLVQSIKRSSEVLPGWIWWMAGFLLMAIITGFILRFKQR